VVLQEYDTDGEKSRKEKVLEGRYCHSSQSDVRPSRRVAFKRSKVDENVVVEFDARRTTG
jgi:hypothetical protein